jgi:two-component system alkaline phosphatase synthesis response regulator PhoP
MPTKAKVLVIDDDPNVLRTTELALQYRGFEVITASNPQDGMQRLEEGRPDAVVLDVMMPSGIEGFQWLWKLRKHADESLREVPVIVVSGVHDTTEMRFHAGDSDETGDYLPAQAFLDKPVNPGLLIEKLKGLLAIDS